ncbi:MAG: radical SAM protein, partial [Treponema sp.]|nr:radical SAM protein [Treponema sp.]
MKVSNIILIQPPFVQLNAPYPSPYYLKSFLEKRGFDVTVLDHSIGLFGKIFSRSGLTRIFYDAGQSEIRDKQTLAIVERFFSEKELWLVAVERIVGFLRGGDHEWGHFLALANGCLPGGPRTDAFLAERDGNIGADETKMYATKLLDDLADFIISTVDPGFSLIRYAPAIEGSLNTGFRDFSAVRNSLDGYIMNTFYRPMLAEEWEKLEHSDSPFVLGLTIPFPGCLSGALVCAESAKNYFGAGVYTIAGGGFVNTELRFLSDPDVFDYFDYISFDRGYGSLVSVLEAIETGEKDGQVLYKTKYRSARTVISCKRIAAPADSEIAGKKNAATELEDTAARTNFPDYSGVDFSRYIYPVDDTNPMHRLWSDGHWLKAYLAHGCYWHSCAFCDVTLDYIRNCIPVDVASL